MYRSTSNSSTAASPGRDKRPKTNGQELPAGVYVDPASIDDTATIKAITNWHLLPYGSHLAKEKAASLWIENIFAGKQNTILLKSGTMDSDAETTTAPYETTSGTWLAGMCVLDWDSKFFGFPIGRLEPLVSPADGTITSLPAGLALLKECLKQAHRLGLAQISVQIHTSDWLSRLALEEHGFTLADTIVCYELDLAAWQPKVISPHIRPCPADTSGELARISGICFSNPQLNANRFVTDPQFDNDSVRRMYELWLSNSISGQLSDKVFAYYDNGQPVGFITVKLPGAAELNYDLSMAKIPLNAVAPSHHRQGIYSHLVAAALSWLKGQSIQSVEIRTQLPNLAVHNCWQASGARIAYSFYTFHLNLQEHAV